MRNIIIQHLDYMFPIVPYREKVFKALSSRLRNPSQRHDDIFVLLGPASGKSIISILVQHSHKLYCTLDIYDVTSDSFNEHMSGSEAIWIQADFIPKKQRSLLKSIATNDTVKMHEMYIDPPVVKNKMSLFIESDKNLKSIYQKGFEVFTCDEPEKTHEYYQIMFHNLNDENINEAIEYIKTF